MVRSVRGFSVICLCVVVVLFVSSPVCGQEKVKLKGTELQELILKPDYASFGLDHKANNVYLVVNQGEGKREVYWRSLANSLVGGTDVTSNKIVDDQVCMKPTFAPETCFDFFQIGEDKYDSRVGGELRHTWYKLPTVPGESSKKRVKLTGEEFRKSEAQPGLLGGVDQINKFVWVVEVTAPGKRLSHLRAPGKPGVSASIVGTDRIVGDLLCLHYSGTEKCYDVYRIGENGYEWWFQGKLEHSGYRLE